MNEVCLLASLQEAQYSPVGRRRGQTWPIRSDLAVRATLSPGRAANGIGAGSRRLTKPMKTGDLHDESNLHRPPSRRHCDQNRVVMAPMTRARRSDTIASAQTAEYYRQRASAGLIVTEGTPISPEGQGYAYVPGIWSPEQAHSAGAELPTLYTRPMAGSLRNCGTSDGCRTYPCNPRANSRSVPATSGPTTKRSTPFSTMAPRIRRCQRAAPAVGQ